MKRCKIGIALLLILLVAGILTSMWMCRCHGTIARDVRMAGAAAHREDWDMALSLTEEAREKWERCWGISAALSDHGLMEQINGLFAQLKVYERAEDETAYAIVCAQLGAAAEAMADAQSMKWWNLL